MFCHTAVYSKKKRHGEGQRKEVYYPALDTPWEEAK
jgi:hypothetical protein